MGSNIGRKLQAKWAKKCLKQRKKGRRVGFNPSLYNSNKDYGNSDVTFFTSDQVAKYENSLTETVDHFIIH